MQFSQASPGAGRARFTVRTAPVAVSEQFPPFAVPDAAAEDEPGGAERPSPFPGDTHWYDLPDDDAAPEEDEGGLSGRFGRWLRSR